MKMRKTLLVILHIHSLLSASSFVITPRNNLISTNVNNGELQVSSLCMSTTTSTATTAVSTLINKAELSTKSKAVGQSKGTDARIIFPGGGIFFYWQAGAASYLREAGYDLSDVTMSGASAGALAATLTLADVDFEEATSLALKLAEDAGVWDRPLGLQGVWGPMIETWLNDLLPDNAVEMVDERLSLLVTSIPSFRTDRISSFESKEDLVRCNMASVHLPWFLDGKLTSNFRQAPRIDGSFRAKTEDYFPQVKNGQVDDSLIILDWKSDPVMEGKTKDFIKLTSKEGIWDLLEQGRSYAQIMDKRGDFDTISQS
mmetsp:Transcript_2312/g.3358  ORF Transcript_2312/g.3358 Transcript_2312/m.3358 type:complete len:315 (-) Transcript_2312:181-1125(-)